MTRRLAFLMLLIPMVGWSATPTLIAHIQALGPGGSNFINATGATLLTCSCVNSQSLATNGTMSDSKGNTWHAGTNFVQGNHNVTTWYAYDHAGTPLVTGVLQFSWVGAAVSSFSERSCAAWSGTLTTANPFDVNVGSTSVGSSVQTSTLTPTLNGELLLTVYGSNQLSNVQTINAGFTVIDRVSQVASTNVGMATAYLVQGLATPANPTWTSSGGSGNNATNLMAFKPGQSKVILGEF